ncbi:hexosaminidase [Marinilabilia salmonicolor]|jgi:hexosaminidase|uniref:family 20 glycosylhydrolase n=1 Tax=Marinilabilia salmonicolor TaxID=989 RepID=UPI000D079CE5|nr:family 20 glycosylhydrolase [Marinilabilia salmonicolor]PRZ01795.1 hexosaminidase [Marinilabilia salmonicolor]
MSFNFKLTVILLLFSGLIRATSPDNTTTQAMLEKLAENFSPEKNINTEGQQLTYVDIPENVKVEIAGTSFEQIIDFEGKIIRPLSDKASQVTFLLKKDTLSALTKTFSITISAKETKTPQDNPKPKVIPALQEWKGTTGSWMVPNRKLSIQIDHKDLEERMEIFAKDYQSLTGNQAEVIHSATDQSKADISVDLSAPSSVGEEGYILNISNDKISISATTPTGAFWGTRTLLQVFHNNEFRFPCGSVRDYPQYPVRGFMYDVGRKPATLEAIQYVMKTMSYYKLNDLQLHLNDNFIWLHEYTEIPNKKDATDEQKAAARKEVMDAAPTAFRLESSMVGENGIPLTSKDVFYTKKQFGNLIDDAKLYGVNIVPEIDVPGHAMSFVRVRPDLMYRGELQKPYDVERTAMLDASEDIFDPETGRTYREETMSFVQEVFDEYLTAEDGEKPVFRDGIVHIGTDEYYGEAEDYRWFANELLTYVKERGFTPRLWGSLTAKPGQTPVTSKGVQMHVWSLGWQRPLDAIDAGFDIINILDVDTYMVPNGTENIGGYGDYVNLQHLYGAKWQPNVMRQYTVIPGHPQMLGAQYALWNDNSFRRTTGLTDYDLYERIRTTGAVIAEKTWNEAKDNSFTDFMWLIKETGTPPSINPQYKADFTVLEPDFSANNPVLQNAKIRKNVIHLKGGKSYVKPLLVENIGPDYIAEFEVKVTGSSNQEQILFSSHTGSFKMVQNKTGQIGFSRDGFDYSFNYTAPKNQWLKIKLIAKGRTLNLFVDGEKIEGPIRNRYPETNRFNTFIFPLEFIGDETNALNGELRNFKITR